jgi:hypothetical protein
MTLTAQSLASAYYARDEVTAFYLAQEGLEVVRNLRDNNILQNAQGGVSVNLLNNIPINTPFRVDARISYTSATTPPLCSADPGGNCLSLQTDSNVNPSTGLYGYTGGWAPTPFTRSMIACYVQPGGACNTIVSDEVKITATVSWKTGSIQSRSVAISQNLYRWVADNSATP